MRYGENPHQKAAFYVEREVREASVANARQLQGKELSYNNIVDTGCRPRDASSSSMSGPPASSSSMPTLAAWPSAPRSSGGILTARECDPDSAFGGIIAFNRDLDGATAQGARHRTFVEVIIAPGLYREALAIFKAKKNVRVMQCRSWPATTRPAARHEEGQRRPARPGARPGAGPGGRLKVVTQAKPTDEEMTAPGFYLAGRQVCQVQCHRLTTRDQTVGSAPAR